MNLCAFCKKQFIVSRKGHIYCSRSCKDKGKHHRIYKKKPITLKIVECKYCSSLFKTRFSNLYCSKKCYDALNYLKNKEKILYNNLLWRAKNPNKMKKINNKSHVKNKHRINERTFVNNHKKEIINIISGSCKLCGSPLKHIHHKRYKNLDQNDLNNYCKALMPLCKEHHNKIHNIIMSWDHKKIIQNYLNE